MFKLSYQNDNMERQTVMIGLKNICRALVPLFAFAACATPGIDYTAKVAPGNPDAATYRTVAVGQFAGPLGTWYAAEFEEMLRSALYEGQPWFTVGLFGGQSNVDGIYGGVVEIGYPNVWETYYTTSECVKRDEEEDKCVKRAEIEHVCVHYSVDVIARPSLIDKVSGDVVHQRSYSGSDTDKECFETGHVEYRVRREPGDPGKGKYRFAYENYGAPGYQLDPNYIIDRLTQSALYSTIWQARRDIAPYNQVVRATILTEAHDLEVRADPRFAQAVEDIRNKESGIACPVFEDLAERYPAAPAVLHNLGACAEALGNQERAQSLYAEATAGLRALGIEPTDRMLNALSRISNQRTDTSILDQLVPNESRPES